jgi:hypothetical protein
MRGAAGARNELSEGSALADRKALSRHTEPHRQRYHAAPWHALNTEATDGVFYLVIPMIVSAAGATLIACAVHATRIRRASSSPNEECPPIK